MRTLLATIVIAVILSSSAFAGMPPDGNPQMGWFIQFNLANCPTVVTVGGSDTGWGSSPADQSHTGLHMGLWTQGTHSSQTVYGAGSPLQAQIYIWSDDPMPTTAEIHWRTLGTNYTDGVYYSPTVWPGATFSLNISGQGIDMPIGEFNEPREGWITTPIYQSGPDGGYVIDLSVNVPDTVPEPGSLAALGTGLLGLAGFALRRRH